MSDISFEKFKEQHLFTLEPGDIAFHAQLFPGEYADDRNRLATIKAHPDQAATVLPEDFLQGLVRRLTKNGVHLDRLRMLPSVSDAYGTADIQADIRLFTGAVAHGENTRFAWFDQQVGRLLDSCGRIAPVQEYLGSVKEGVPRGSFWALWKARADLPHVVRIMRYRNNTDGHSALDTETQVPPTDQAQLRFVSFCRDVFYDRSQSFDFKTASTMPTLEYPRAEDL